MEARNVGWWVIIRKRPGQCPHVEDDSCGVLSDYERVACEKAHCPLKEASKDLVEAIASGDAATHTYQRLEVTAVKRIEDECAGDPRKARAVVAKYLRVLGCDRLVDAWLAVEKVR